MGLGFLHQEHRRDQRQNRDPHQPEVIDEGLHGGPALDEAVEEAVGLGGGLRGGRDLSELARTQRVGMETICQILKRAGRAVTNPSRCLSFAKIRSGSQTAWLTPLNNVNAERLTC